MPKELREYQERNESFTVSGKTNCGQGADFSHEEINKLVKSFLPPGMPTTEKRDRVCRKATELREMKNKATNSADTTERKAYKKFENVVIMKRREVRHKLLQSPPQSYRPLSSLNGNLLDAQLTDIKYIAEENYKNYKPSYCASGQFGCKIKNPIFITKIEREESQKIEAKSKNEIANEINILLGELPGRTTATEMYENLEKNRKRLKHRELIKYYYMVKNVVEQQVAGLTLDEENE